MAYVRHIQMVSGRIGLAFNRNVEQLNMYTENLQEDKSMYLGESFYFFPGLYASPYNNIVTDSNVSC